MTMLLNYVRDLHRLGVSVPAIALCMLASVIVTVWVCVTPFTAPLLDLMGGVAIIGALLLATFAYSTWRRDAFAASLLGGFAVQVWGALSMGYLAMLALGAGFPLVDPTLATIDAALGVDHRALLAWLAEHPTLSWSLRMLYSSAVPASLAVMLVLAISRRFDDLRDFVLLWQMTLFACTALSIFTPAIGVYAHLEISPDIVAQMPTGSGLYHLDVFNAVRSGQLLTLTPSTIEGVVTFPSFHICMALTIAYALRHVPLLAPIAMLYGAGVAVATVPIGGHYLIDLIGGSAIFMASAWAIRPRLRGRQQRPEGFQADAAQQPLAS